MGARSGQGTEEVAESDRQHSSVGAETLQPSASDVATVVTTSADDDKKTMARVRPRACAHGASDAALGAHPEYATHREACSKQARHNTLL